MTAQLRRRIVVNGAFRPQRITGQQRYATEIADRLVTSGAVEVRPGAFWGASSARTWLWSLLVLPLRTRRSVLVSLTARAPVVHPRQVLAVHDLFVIQHPEWYSRSYVLSHSATLKAQLRTAAALCAVSAPVAEQLADVASLRPVTIAANAPSAVFADAQEDAELLRRVGLDTGRYLLAIGNQEPRKNLSRLARAWAGVPERHRLACPLAIVGVGASIYAEAATIWPTGTVVTGYVSDRDLAGLYAAARGVVFVSLAEGFGLPIVEAAAAGVRRFVLSDIPVFRWIAGDAARFVDPGSEESIAGALLDAVRHDTTTTARVDVSRFDWDASAAAVMAAALAIARR